MHTCMRVNTHSFFSFVFFRIDRRQQRINVRKTSHWRLLIPIHDMKLILGHASWSFPIRRQDKRWSRRPYRHVIRLEEIERTSRRIRSFVYAIFKWKVSMSYWLKNAVLGDIYILQASIHILNPAAAHSIKESVPKGCTSVQTSTLIPTVKWSYV